MSFNVGVEIGQVLALTAVLIALSIWRTRSGFLRYAFATNTALMTVGFILVGYQIAGYLTHERLMTERKRPSKGAIVKATLIALAVALLLLFTAVLPAEYGIDPLQTGKLLRLTGISQSDSNSGGRATPVNRGNLYGRTGHV